MHGRHGWHGDAGVRDEAGEFPSERKFPTDVLPALLVWFHGVRSPITIVASLVCVFVFWSHRANIKRLRDGTEHRFRRSTSGEAV